MPDSVEGWEAEWAQRLARDDEDLRQWREFGVRCGVSEAEIQAQLKKIREGHEMMQDIFKTAWMLWAVSKLIGTPKWRRKKRAALRAVIARLKAPVTAFVTSPEKP